MVRFIAQPIPSTPTPTAPVNSTAPSPTVATVATQTPMVKSVAASILITVYNLAKVKFSEIPYPTGRPQTEGNPFIQNSNPPPLEDIPDVPVRETTPCPSTGSAPENLFEARKYWPISPTLAPTVKIEAPPQIAVIPYTMVMPKQVVEIYSWGLHCPICKNEEGRKNSQEISTHKTLSIPSHKIPSTLSHKTLSTSSHLMSLTGTLNKSV